MATTLYQHTTVATWGQHMAYVLYACAKRPLHAPGPWACQVGCTWHAYPTSAAAAKAHRNVWVHGPRCSPQCHRGLGYVQGPRTGHHVRAQVRLAMHSIPLQYQRHAHRPGRCGCGMERLPG